VDELAPIKTDMLRAVRVANMGQVTDLREDVFNQPYPETWNAWYDWNTAWQAEKIWECEEVGAPTIPIRGITAELRGTRCPIDVHYELTRAKVLITLGIYHVAESPGSDRNILFAWDVNIEARAQLFKRLRGICKTPTSKLVTYNNPCTDEILLDGSPWVYEGMAVESTVAQWQQDENSEPVLLPNEITTEWKGKVGPIRELSQINWRYYERPQQVNQPCPGVAILLDRTFALPAMQDSNFGGNQRYLGVLGITAT
jgi:hypothetical protein